MLALRLDRPVFGLDFGFDVVPLGFERLDFGFEVVAFRFERPPVGVERVQRVESALDLRATRLEALDFGLDGVGVDQGHDDVVEVALRDDRPPRLVRAEEERKAVRGRRVSEIGRPVGRDCPVLTREEASVRPAVEFEFDRPLVGVAFEADRVAPARAHERPQERRSVRRVAAGEHGHAGVEPDAPLVDTADVSYAYSRRLKCL